MTHHTDEGRGPRDSGGHGPLHDDQQSGLIDHDELLNCVDERIVVGRAADGDVVAFRVLVSRYGPMMRAAARRIVRSSADVDDVVQEAFIAAWQRLDQLEDPRKVKSWLMRIVNHRAIDRIRASKQFADAAEIELAAPDKHSPSRVTETKATVAALRDAIGALPEAQRQCWILREVDAMSYRDISEVLDLPESTVRGLLARARKGIMTQMEGWQ